MKTSTMNRNWGTILVIIAIIFIIIAPSLFSGKTFAWQESNILINTLFRNIDFSSTGQIGDTIGGITAPFVGVLSIILLYMTLKSQQKQIKEQNDKDNIRLLCEQLIKDIDNFTYTEIIKSGNDTESKAVYKSSEAIAKVLHWRFCEGAHLKQDDLEIEPLDCELLSILNLCKEAKIALDSSDIKDKSAFNQVITHQFRYRIYPEIKRNGTDKLKKTFCQECNCMHGFPDEMADMIKFLENKLI
jgi:hypothetical protein